MNNETQLEIVSDIAAVGPALDPFVQAEVETVRTKYPEAVNALAEYKKIYLSHVQGYRQLIARLRGLNLAPRELTVLLLSEGWAKTRASEFKTVLELPVPQYEAYQKRLVGFRGALASARAVRSAGRGIPAGPSLVETAAKEFRHWVNAVQCSVFTQKKASCRLERLGCVFTLIVSRKPVKPAKKGKAAAPSKKVRAHKRTKKGQIRSKGLDVANKPIVAASSS